MKQLMPNIDGLWWLWMISTRGGPFVRKVVQIDSFQMPRQPTKQQQQKPTKSIYLFVLIRLLSHSLGV